ncbi:MAG: PKD domain-containing protein, partial [Chitinivibrionales bacterium]|nr:PKD domain-containing protein [Chitinivibrionales bacterium]
MKSIPLGILTVWLVALSVVAQDAEPEWLDKEPPVVTVDPQTAYHQSVFVATFRTDEPSTIHVSVNAPNAFEPYDKPVSIGREGRTVLYFYAEDDFGNRSETDSVVYVVDSRAPKLTVSPDTGVFRAPVTVTFETSEPSRIYTHTARNDTVGTTIGRSMTVSDSFDGYVSAQDSAGNRTTVGPLRYVVSAQAKPVVTIDPPGGTYAMQRRFTLSSSPPCTSFFYTFDPQALPESFTRYGGQATVPPGRTIVRFYGIDKHGWRTDIGKAVFVVDTAAPKVRIRHVAGPRYDTLYLMSREAERIHYTVGAGLPTDDSPVYDGPITLRKEGVARVKAFGVDRAGNRSQMVTWEKKYDVLPPRLTMTPGGGLYSRPVRVKLKTNELSRIFCTIDGEQPDTNAHIYDGEVTVSRQGRTVLRCIPMDEAGNIGTEQTAVFTVDTVAPVVRSRIEGSPADGEFRVYLTANEESRIFYARGGASPTTSSANYNDVLTIRGGEELRFFAVDRAGNRSTVYTLGDLAKPLVSAIPSGGQYNRPLAITFKASMSSTVFWRLLPDTTYRTYRDTVRLDEPGSYTVDYYAQTAAGVAGPVRREEYTIDLVAPQVHITLKRGAGDSAIVLFEASENATIYYTLDGSSPYDSPSTRTAGSKLMSSGGRAKVLRSEDARLAYYAEDAAGNMSRLNVVDLFKPRAVPSVPAGPDIMYDRALSVALHTYDEGKIYYSRHGNTPTVDSTLYQEPITIVRSDTICAFVVDQSGTFGEVDTFVYIVDLPPQASYEVSPEPESLMVGVPVTFDASSSTDTESPLAGLTFRWDFDGDGKYDTEHASSPSVGHTYRQEGIYTPVVQARDERGRTATYSRDVVVRRHCPGGMVFVADTAGRTFCVDRYEWPNVKGRQPLANVSWVEAKMHCLDVGKRLCTAAEWEAACRGRGVEAYPYGSDYIEERCPTEGNEPFEAGSFAECGDGFGLRD